MSDLLYGKDTEERIVGIAAHGKTHVRLWSRSETDEVTDRIERMHPFIFCTQRGIEEMQEAIGPHNFQHAPLSGENEMNRLAAFRDTELFREARKALYADPVQSDKFFTYGDPAAAYLVQSGKTMFKGLTPQTSRRMQFDIEAYRPDGFPDAARDPIIIISMCDNRGWEKVLYIDQTTGKIGARAHHDILRGETPGVYEMCANEADMLRAFIRYIHQTDPDILEGHNVFAFDLHYIEARCQLHGVRFAIGRDGTEPYTYETEKKFAERDIKYRNYVAAGRSIVDTMFLAIDWDVYTRALDGVGLKEVAKTLGVAPPDREYIDGDQIAYVWKTDPDRVLRYALHDVYETRGIADQLISAQFALAQMLPFPLQKVHLGGKAGSIQSLFIREYLRNRASLPVSEQGTQNHGGYTDIFQLGVFDRVWYADVASLYPSIMLNYDIKPAGDHLGLFQKILRELTDLRFATKRAMKDADGIRKAELDARQSAFKIIINSFYGMLGAGGQVLFATVSEADRVAITGQGLLRRMLELIEARGGDIIECDTDGVLFTAPPDRNFETDGPAFCAEITEKMPKGINVDFDGAFPAMMSLAKKNYALWNGKKVKMKGGSLKSRGLEPIFRHFIISAVDSILKRDTVSLRELYVAQQQVILSRETEPAFLAKTVTLKESFAEYDNKVEAGGNRAPQYEIGKDLVSGKGRRVQKGDRISYVICGTGSAAKVTAYRDATALEFVKPGTHHRAHYLKRLHEISAGRFGTLFAQKDIAKVFPEKPVMPDQGTLFPEIKFEGVPITNTRIKQPNASPNL